MLNHLCTHINYTQKGNAWKERMTDNSSLNSTVLKEPIILSLKQTLTLYKVAKCLTDGTLSINGFSQFELHPKSSEGSALDEIFILDTLNFCFWTPDNMPKWTVSFNNKSYTGYFALCAAICRAKQEGLDITNPHFLQNTTLDSLRQIFRSDNEVEMPLLQERLACLHEVARILIEHFNGTFRTCVEKSDKSAMTLLGLIVNNFPCFRDEANYKGHRVSFYKRAQILVGDVWACYRGTGLGEFTDIDQLTMFADYRVPQVLLHFGAMAYTETLMEKLKKETPLDAGCEEEIEIRGCSIFIVECIVKELKKLSQDEIPELKDLIFNSVMIDHFLWDYRRAHANALACIPFHHTTGIYY